MKNVFFHNTDLVSKKAHRYCDELSHFILNKFFQERRLRYIFVDVSFEKNLFKEYGQYGNCIWEDQHYKPNEFSIELEPNQPLPILLNSLAHELVHVKQWAKGEYYQTMKNRRVYKYNNKYYNVDKVDYWDQPWEIEAHGRAIGLMVQWNRTLPEDRRLKIPETL